MLAHSCVPVLAVTIWFHLCGLCCTSYIGPCFYLWNSQINFGEKRKKKGNGNFDDDDNAVPHHHLDHLCTFIVALFSSCSSFEAAVSVPYAEAFVADSVTAKVFAFVSRCALGRMCMCFCVVIERTRHTTA